jgi:hypothetical protein
MSPLQYQKHLRLHTARERMSGQSHEEKAKVERA